MSAGLSRRRLLPSSVPARSASAKEHSTTRRSRKLPSAPGDQTRQMQHFARELAGIATDRGRARAVQRRQQGPLRIGHRLRYRILDRREKLAQLRRVGTNRDAHDALAGRRYHHVGIDHDRGLVLQAQAAHARQCQQARGEIAPLHLVEPAMDVAPDGPDLQVGPGMQELSLAADGAGADHGAVGKAGVGVRRIHDVVVLAEDQRVTGIFAGERAGEDDPRGQERLEVLEGMDGEVDPAIHQRLVDLLGEQPFAADIGQPLPARLGGVPSGADRVFLKHVHAAQHRAEFRQRIQERPGLHKGQRRGARANTQRQPGMMRTDMRIGLCRRVMPLTDPLEPIQYYVHRHSPQLTLFTCCIRRVRTDRSAARPRSSAIRRRRPKAR